MREGIAEKLPATLPVDKDVLVIGHPEAPSQSLKSLISDLNRGHKWIRAEWGDVSESQITSKIALILTMYRANPGTIANMRKVAKKLDICCPPQALTSAEVKNILEKLGQTRDKNILAPKNGTQNGNDGIHTTETKLTKEENVAQIEQPAKLETTVSNEPAQNPDDTESALAILDKFRGIVEETQLAVMLIGDQLKAAVAECGKCHTQLKEKDVQIAELNILLATANKSISEHTDLENENRELKIKLTKLQKTFDSLGSLIQSTR